MATACSGLVRGFLCAQRSRLVCHVVGHRSITLLVSSLIASIILISPQPVPAAVVVDPGGIGADDVYPTNPASWTSNNDAYIGKTASGELLVDGGSGIESDRSYLGNESGSTGKLTVDGTNSIWTNGLLRVGDSGTGTLAITNGGAVNSNSFCHLGHYSGSAGTVTVNGAESTWTIDSNIDSGLSVGFYGTGTMSVTGGGTVNCSGYSNYVGHYSGSSGSATVDGANSIWTNSGYLYIGYEGEGTLEVNNGGAVSNSSGYIGRVSGSTGTVTVDGTNSTWTNNYNLYVGFYSSGTLEITNGGAVSNSSGYTGSHGYIGYCSGSTGSVAVDGAGSTWTNSNSLYIGHEGNGSLEITNGGAVSDTYGRIGEESGSTGTVTVDGTDSNWVSSKYLIIGANGDGTLDVTNGGAVSNTDGTIGYYAGSTSIVTVDGTDSIWANSRDLYVGRYGSGTLNINDGGLVVASGTTYVANYSGSQGTINFNNGTLDAGTIFASDANLKGTGTIIMHGVIFDDNRILDSPDDLVGHYRTIDGQPNQNITVNLNLDGQGILGTGNTGTGSFIISSGFAVASTYGYIGYESGSTGTAVVDGTGSTWTNSSTLYVGRNGNGTLNITNGGAVSNYSGYIAYGSGTTGKVTVDGTDSTWANSSTLDIGRSGNGTLEITNGGTVSNSNACISYWGTDSTNTVTVDGTGSTWTNSGNLRVGCWGSGALTITWNGLVSVKGILAIDHDADDDCFVNMAAGGMLALLGDAHDSIDDFLDLVDGTDAIRYWDESSSDWAPITSATPGTDYTLTYVNDTGSDLYQYTILTVLTTTVPGDANWDGAVNELDAAVLAANWCKSGGWSNGDFNHDGMVDATDASILAANWQQGTEESTTVPEPAVMAMLLGSTLVMLRRWR